MTPPPQLPLDLGHRAAMGGEDFMVAPSNAEAVAWLDRWPDWPAPALTLFGPAGCGKTHLANVWRARSNAPLITPADLDPDRVPEILAGTGGVAIDGADRVAGDPVAERALFHLYNLAKEAGAHLLLLARAAPAHWTTSLPDLRSRLVAAPAVAVQAPDDALLAAVLVKLFADRQLRPGQEVVDYLLRRMERSCDSARRIVAALDRASLAAKRPVTVPLVRAVMAEEEG